MPFLVFGHKIWDVFPLNCKVLEEKPSAVTALILNTSFVVPYFIEKWLCFLLSLVFFNQLAFKKRTQTPCVFILKLIGVLLPLRVNSSHRAGMDRAWWMWRLQELLGFLNRCCSLICKSPCLQSVFPCSEEQRRLLSRNEECLAPNLLWSQIELFSYTDTSWARLQILNDEHWNILKSLQLKHFPWRTQVVIA